MANRQPYQLTTRTLGLTDVLPTQAADGTTEVGKNTIQDIVDLITPESTVITVKRTLTSAEILALNSTPITLVAAPGAGKIIQPLALSYNMVFNSVAYTTNILLLIKFEGVSGNFNTSSILGGSTDLYQRVLLSTNLSYNPIPSNTALVADVQTGNPTAGDSPLDVYVTYTVITL